MVTSSTSDVRGLTVPNRRWKRIECSTARSTSFVWSRSRTCLPSRQNTMASSVSLHSLPAQDRIASPLHTATSASAHRCTDRTCVRARTGAASNGCGQEASEAGAAYQVDGDGGMSGVHARRVRSQSKENSDRGTNRVRAQRSAAVIQQT
ncbi:hypothetical protein BD414DRAFT_101920 [Trametes punicea]|nr:hypothetical protein BD414DRAFT_101920 [Trametes punicea]